MPRYRAARLILPEHPLHGQSVDILHQEGQPIEIQPSSSVPLDEKDGDRDLGHAFAFAGWWDLKVDFRDPGTERAEGLNHGLKVAAQGGFSSVAPVTSTHPFRDQPADIRALQHQSQDSITSVLPLAALSKNGGGIELTEAHALVQAGAMGFSDNAPIQRPELLRRALEYLAPLGAPVFSEAHDPSFQPEGIMHEGAVSTRLGLPGLSEEAETLRIRRDLDILKYTQGQLHIPVVTTAAGISAIRSAKSEGLQVTCGTTFHHLCWTDENLDNFNSDLKLSRPIRSETDRDALLKAALDGTLDVVVSDHCPRTPEEHDADFLMVANGIAGIHAVGPAVFGALSGYGANTEDSLAAMSRLLASGPPAHFEKQSGRFGCKIPSLHRRHLLRSRSSNWPFAVQSPQHGVQRPNAFPQRRSGWRGDAQGRPLERVSIKPRLSALQNSWEKTALADLTFLWNRVATRTC